MEDLKALLIGVFGSLIVLFITKLYKTYRKKSIKEDIEFLEYEKKHLEEMKRSSVEMGRSSFRALFAVLALIALANLIPSFFIFSGIDLLAKAGDLIGFVLWASVFGLAIRFWKRYDNLKNFKEATNKMEEKLVLLKSKYDKSQ